LTVTTICRTASLSSYCGCAWARWRGPDPNPSSAEAMITGTKRKYSGRKPLTRCGAIRRLSPRLLITVPPCISHSMGSHQPVSSRFALLTPRVLPRLRAGRSRSGVKGLSQIRPLAVDPGPHGTDRCNHGNEQDADKHRIFDQRSAVLVLAQAAE